MKIYLIDKYLAMLVIRFHKSILYLYKYNKKYIIYEIY